LAAINEGQPEFAFPKDSNGRSEGPECFALKPAPSRDVVNDFDVLNEEVLSVAGLSGEVHDFVQLEEKHLQGFEERIVMEDIHYSPRLGNGSDHARVYTKGCSNTGSGEFCNACAIAFTATTDSWDMEEDLNINLASFCGLSQVHAGFVGEMRSYMNHSNWTTALSMMTKDKCQRAYAVGASLGGAIASLFAFCANQASVVDDDKLKFVGNLDIIPISFGAPAIAKEQVYNGKPGQCFRGARVAIASPTAELDAASTITGMDIIRGVLEAYRGLHSTTTQQEHHGLNNAIAELTALQEDADEFAKKKAAVFEDIMPSVVLELKDFLMTLLAPSADSTPGSSSRRLTGLSGDLLPYLVPLSQLIPLASNETVAGVAKFFAGESVQLGPSPDFTFDYDAVPGLLSGFNFQHALVPYYKVAHPDGQQPHDDGLAVGACDTSAHEPKADFVKVLFASLGSFLTPVLARSGEPNFPNHHPCCYVRGLSGEARGACGDNQADGKSFSCHAPSWR